MARGTRKPPQPLTQLGWSAAGSNAAQIGIDGCRWMT
jgi:hypothetical protein